MDNIKQICVELANLAKREHYFCEDIWYSCPKAEGGCANDAEGDECTCGADAHNAKVNELLAAALAEPEEPTDEELYDLMYEFTIGTGHGERLDEIGFARAVLARWGNRSATH
jgi:hypothetical protein